ncbi:MAG: hypothetical protein A4E71_03217 [Smithella sp. PtaU1.Bin162]|nr:MAG: hypothetical protein A4E71_03217 [Smithella sp. PtaU1.Bin162]
MLMLTHTYFLQNFLDTLGVKKINPDVFVYNIVPDLLTIHPAITSRQTHKIKRLRRIPPLYPKAAYIMFHLLFDDLAHYGLICSGIPADFNPDSQGYSYIKGKALVRPIMEFQKKLNREVSYNEAVYRSHLVVEMIYDLAIMDQINNNQTIGLLAEAVLSTTENSTDEFIATINWLYGLGEKEIREVLKRACSYVTKERLQKIMNIDGRIRLYADKFGLRNNEQLYCPDIKNIFLQARELLGDNEIFLREAAEAVKKHGWLPPVT